LKGLTKNRFTNQSNILFLGQAGDYTTLHSFAQVKLTIRNIFDADFDG
jgi:hypothetical protein